MEISFPKNWGESRNSLPRSVIDECFFVVTDFQQIAEINMN
jgi:hypothetical protein